MKKRWVISILFLFSSVYAQTNKIGISVGIINVDADVPIRECVGISYEKTFFDYKELSIGGEVEVLLSPFVNFYALNLNSFVEFDFGTEVGKFRTYVTPIAFMNFATLFTEKCYLNYNLGVGVGWQKEISERMYLDLRFILALRIYCIEPSTNANLSLAIKYCF